MTFGCVVLTTGSRPEVLALALESLPRGTVHAEWGKETANLRVMRVDD